MIFLLSNRLEEIIEWNEAMIFGLEQLCASAFSGKHFVTLSRPSVGTSILRRTEGKASIITSAVIKRAMANHALQGSLHENNFRTITVTSENDPDFGYPGKLPITRIPSLSLNSSILICENQVDAEVFEIAARCFLAANRLKGIKISAQIRGGGGTQIAAESKAIAINQKNPCLIVTDGDNNWPGRPPSSTSRECQEIADAVPDLCEHYRLPVRDLENIFPPSILHSALIHQRENISELAELFVREPSSAFHCDIKDGTTLKKYFSFGNDSNEKHYLCDIIKLRAEKLSQRCLKNERCSCEMMDEQGCKCVIVPSLGAKTSEQVLNWLKSNSHVKVNEQFKDDWRAIWEQIGEKVASWCCAPEPMLS